MTPTKRLYHSVQTLFLPVMAPNSPLLERQPGTAVRFMILTEMSRF